MQDTVPGSAVHEAAEDHRDGTEVSGGCPLHPVGDGLLDGGGRFEVGDVEAREAVLEPVQCQRGGFGVVAGDMDGANSGAGSTQGLAKGFGGAAVEARNGDDHQVSSGIRHPRRAARPSRWPSSAAYRRGSPASKVYTGL